MLHKLEKDKHTWGIHTSSCHMCHTRLEALANDLHHWELFIICLNCIPLNSPFIHFITSSESRHIRRSTATVHSQLCHWHWMKSVDAHSVHYMYYMCSKHPIAAALLKCLWAKFCIPSSSEGAAVEVTLLGEGGGEIPPQGSINYHITLHPTCLTGSCVEMICLYIQWPYANFTLFSL